MSLSWKLAIVLVAILFYYYGPSFSPKANVIKKSYVAAVVEFHPVADNPTVTTVTQNLEYYLDFITTAKEQKADIIVFPEYALTSIAPYNRREMAIEFSQPIPDPSTNTQPCSMDLNDPGDIIKKLSCAAKTNQMYVVVNLLEKFWNDSSKEWLIYNSNVAFDRNGAVVGRYRKFNLFGEVAINQTENPETSIFETDFGMKFGISTCFDIMFQRPTGDLVKIHKVDGLVFPTAWFSELPFLTALQAQAAWAFGMKVHLLAAGYNSPALGSTGSGIYQDGRFSAVAFSDNKSKLLVQRVSSDVINSEIRSYSCHFKTSEENLERYVAKPLVLSSTLQTDNVCYGDFCCQVEYQFKNEVKGKFHYKLLIFNGSRMHAGIYKSRLEVCGIVACANDEKQSCAYGFDQTSYSRNLTFSHLKISANFSTDLVLPNTLEANTCGPIRTEQYNLKTSESNNFTMQLLHKTTGLHTFALYSHGFIE